MRRVYCLLFFAVLTCVGQTPASDNITAKLSLGITPEGDLNGALTIAASGPRSTEYRDAVKQGKQGIANAALFAGFLQAQQIKSRDAEGPLLRLEVFQGTFLLPIKRRQDLQLDILSMTLPAGASPGVMREEITFTMPAGFAPPAESRITQENAFARYQSEVKIEGGKLLVVRELHIKKPIVSGDADLETFRRTIHEDQQRHFLLRRTSNVNLTQWVRSVPPELIRNYASQAFNLREFDAARQLYQRAVEEKPDDASGWYFLGRTLYDLDRPEDAVKAFLRQIDLDPKHQDGYRLMALAQENLGYWDRAINGLRKQLEITPGDSNVTVNLVWAYFEAGRWGEAEDVTVKALEAKPDNTALRVDLAVIRVCNGNIANARQRIDEAMGSKPTGTVLDNAAEYLATCGQQLELAEQYVSRTFEQAKVGATSSRSGTVRDAIRFQINLGAHADTYGWVLLKEGKIERALNLLAVGVALAPDGIPFAHLAQAEAKRGHKDLALLNWRQATFFSPGLISVVPPDLASQLSSTPQLSLDRQWYPVKNSFAGVVAGTLRADQPCYFFVIANENGSLKSARALDSSDAVATDILPALQTLTFPVIDIDGKASPAVYILRVAKDLDGKVVVARSVGPEARAIASDLAPDEFGAPASPPAAPAPSVANPTTGAYKIGGGVSQPSVIRKVEPQYSEEARKIGLAGMLDLNCVIGPNGKTRDCKVKQPLGLGLDEKAMEAVDAWEFKPGTKDGQPVAVFATMRITFHLGVGIKWHTAGLEFQMPPVASRPTVDKGAAPHIVGDPEATASMAFEVDEHGNPSNVRVEKASDEQWAREAVTAVEKWKFSPGMKTGIQSRFQ